MIENCLKYYSLNEVAKLLKCTDLEVIRLGIEGKINVGVYFRHWPIEKGECVIESGTYMDEDETECKEEQYECPSDIPLEFKLFTGIAYLPSWDLIEIERTRFTTVRSLNLDSKDFYAHIVGYNEAKNGQFCREFWGLRDRSELLPRPSIQRNEDWYPKVGVNDLVVAKSDFEKFIKIKDAAEQAQKITHSRQDQQDRKSCQLVAQTLWYEHPEWTIEKIIKHHAILIFANGKQYKDKKTLRGWVSEVDSRPPEKKRGRPKKEKVGASSD